MMFKIIFILSLAFGSSLALPTAYVSGDGDDSASPSMRGLNHLVKKYNLREPAMTCDRFPRICRAKGSPGPDCCRKQCVDVMTDGLNCGECGRRCRYGEACCGGECVSVMYDPKHCGGCKKSCKEGNFCNYGMCDYA